MRIRRMFPIPRKNQEAGYLESIGVAVRSVARLAARAECARKFRFENESNARRGRRAVCPLTLPHALSARQSKLR